MYPVGFDGIRSISTGASTDVPSLSTADSLTPAVLAGVLVLSGRFENVYRYTSIKYHPYQSSRKTTAFSVRSLKLRSVSCTQ